MSIEIEGKMQITCQEIELIADIVKNYDQNKINIDFPWGVKSSKMFSDQFSHHFCISHLKPNFAGRPIWVCGEGGQQKTYLSNFLAILGNLEHSQFFPFGVNFFEPPLYGKV